MNLSTLQITIPSNTSMVGEDSSVLLMVNKLFKGNLKFLEIIWVLSLNQSTFRTSVEVTIKKKKNKNLPAVEKIITGWALQPGNSPQQCSGHASATWGTEKILLLILQVPRVPWEEFRTPRAAAAWGSLINPMPTESWQELTSTKHNGLRWTQTQLRQNWPSQTLLT